MMKKMVPIALAAVLVVGSTLVINQVFAQEDGRKKGEGQADHGRISIEQATEAARQQVDGKVKSVELDKDDGVLHYEVEIVKDGVDYDVDVHASTGEILKVDKDDDDDKRNIDAKSYDDDRRNDDAKSNDDDRRNVQSTKTAVSDKESFISQEEAIAIAKQRFDGRVVEIELDRDDGRYVYEIELKNGNSEAEFEIDAKTGKILELDIEYDDD